MIGLIPFIIGLLGTISFVFFRLWEVRRTRRFFENYRALLDRMTERLYGILVFGEIPRHYRTRLALVVRSLSHRAVHSAVLALRALERPLARVSHRMRMSAAESEREPSDFLKTITPQKKDGKNEVDSV